MMDETLQQAEMAIIGGLLLSEETLLKATGYIDSDDFEDERNRFVFEAAMQLVEKGTAVEVVSLSEQLKSLKKYEAVGGSAYLMDCLNTISFANELITYIHIVKDKSLARRFFAAVDKIKHDYETKEVEDISSFIGDAEKTLVDITKQRRVSDFLASKDVVGNLVTKLDAKRAAREKLIGIRPPYLTGTPTNYQDLDKVTHGWQKGDLIILAARPSVGKTALALNFATRAAQQGIPVGIFSLEMGADQIIMRLLSERSKVTTSDIEQLPLKKSAEYFDPNFATNKDDQLTIASLSKALDKISKEPIFIDDSGFNTLMDIQAKSRKLKNNHPDLGLIVIDYIGLINASSKNRKGDRQQEIAEISRGLKALAKEIEVPILCLCQLSRRVEEGTNHIPQLSDLRDSGAIEQDADQVFFIYRPDYYADRGDKKKGEENNGYVPPEPPIEGEEDKNQPSANSEVQLILSKNRSGQLGKFDFMFMKQYCHFEMVYREKGYNDK